MGTRRILATGALLLVLAGCASPTWVATRTAAPVEAAAPGEAGEATDVAAAVGIGQTVRTYSVDGGDPDAQHPPGTIWPSPQGEPWGIPPDDALIIRHDPQAHPNLPLPQLFISDGAAMTQPFASWTASDRHDCAWGDYDRDGDLDLFCAVGLDLGSTNELWANNGDGSFADVSSSQGFGDTGSTHGKYRQATFVDANSDGWPDVYVTRVNNAEAGRFPSPADTHPNELWINRGDNAGFFLDTSMGLTTMASAAGGNDGCNAAFDYDGNGTQDIIMCGAAGFRLYKNSDNASFANVSKAVGAGGTWADAEWGDFNADGRADLAQVKATRVRVLEQTAAHSFRSAWSAPATGGFNLAVGDSDGDGALDLYVVSTCTGSPLVDRADHIFYGSSSNVGAAVGAPLSFAVQQIPSLSPASEGCGNSVEAIDYDRDRRADFLVLNGRKTTAGPVQLWTNSP